MKITTSASCSTAPDSRRSESIGIFGLRDSTLRLSWESAITGTSSSRASIFRPRDICPITSARLSLRDSVRSSCR